MRMHIRRESCALLSGLAALLGASEAVGAGGAGEGTTAGDATSEGAEAAAPDPEDAEGSGHDWALVGGIGLGAGFAGVGMGGLGAAGPSGALAIERRLVSVVWLVGRIRASYAQLRADYGWGEEERRGLSLGGALGLRLVANPDDAVRFSGYLAATADFSAGAAGSASYGGQHATAWSAGGELGATLDADVTEAFGLRLSAAVLEASRDFYRVSLDDGSDEQGGVGGRVGLAFSPAVEARVSF